MAGGGAAGAPTARPRPMFECLLASSTCLGDTYTYRTHRTTVSCPGARPQCGGVGWGLRATERTQGRKHALTGCGGCDRVSGVASRVAAAPAHRSGVASRVAAVPAHRLLDMRPSYERRRGLSCLLPWRCATELLPYNLYLLPLRTRPGYMHTQHAIHPVQVAHYPQELTHTGARQGRWGGWGSPPPV